MTEKTKKAATAKTTFTAQKFELNLSLIRPKVSDNFDAISIRRVAFETCSAIGDSSLDTVMSVVELIRRNREVSTIKDNTGMLKEFNPSLHCVGCNAKEFIEYYKQYQIFKKAKKGDRKSFTLPEKKAEKAEK